MPTNWRRLYPFESHFLRVADARMHYIDTQHDGSEDNGEILLLVHGNPTWSFHWRALISAWRGSRRVVAADHLGCGLSDKPAGTTYRLADRIEHLVELIRQLDLTHVTLVAHDWGGAIGLGAALAVPDRFDRFVLLNTGAFPPRGFPWRIRILRTPIVGRLAVQGLNLFSQAALRMTTVTQRPLPPDVCAGYLAPYDSWPHRSAVYQFVADIPQGPAHPSYRKLAEIEARLPRFANRPCQLIWGMQDWCFRPDSLERFRELFPDARVERIEEAGHWVVEDATERVIATVDRFLAETCSTGTVRSMTARPTADRPDDAANQE
ncbi:MAG: alpha/beta fold hydrolase [Pirellulales bacterium]